MCSQTQDYLTKQESSFQSLNNDPMLDIKHYPITLLPRFDEQGNLCVFAATKPGTQTDLINELHQFEKEGYRLIKLEYNKTKQLLNAVFSSENVR